MNITVKQIEFKSSDGQSTVFGWIYLPETPRGMVQLVHGMAEHMGRYHEFMRWLAQNGYAACGIDQIGHGRSAQEGCYGFFAEQDGWKRLLEDQYRFNRIVQSEAPGLACFLLGHSMGSFIARLYAARYPQTLSGLALVGTARAGLRVDLALRMAIKSVKQNGSHFQDKKLNRTAFGSFNDRIQPTVTGFDWLTRNTEAVLRYKDDPACGFVFTAAGFRDLFTLLNAANEQKCFEATDKDTPILLLSGSMDPVGEYGKGPTQVYRRYNKAGGTDVSLVLYEGGRHELLNETNRMEVWQELENWLDEHLEAAQAAQEEEFDLEYPED